MTPLFEFDYYLDTIWIIRKEEGQTLGGIRSAGGSRKPNPSPRGGITTLPAGRRYRIGWGPHPHHLPPNVSTTSGLPTNSCYPPTYLHHLL
jgi:hypothetical protein